MFPRRVEGTSQMAEVSARVRSLPGYVFSPVHFSPLLNAIRSFQEQTQKRRGSGVGKKAAKKAGRKGWESCSNGSPVAASQRQFRGRKNLSSFVFYPRNIENFIDLAILRDEITERYKSTPRCCLSPVSNGDEKFARESSASNFNESNNDFTLRY